MSMGMGMGPALIVMCDGDRNTRRINEDDEERKRKRNGGSLGRSRMEKGRRRVRAM